MSEQTPLSGFQSLILWLCFQLHLTQWYFKACLFPPFLGCLLSLEVFQDCPKAFRMVYHLPKTLLHPIHTVKQLLEHFIPCPYPGTPRNPRLLSKSNANSSDKGPLRP